MRGQAESCFHHNMKREEAPEGDAKGLVNSCTVEGRELDLDFLKGHE